MGLFSIFSNKTSSILGSQKKEPSRFTFINSATFRGYHRLWVTNYGDEESQNGLKSLRQVNPKYPNGNEPKYIFKLGNAVIDLIPFQYNIDDTGIIVLVNNVKVGAFFANDEKDKKYLDSILTEKVSAVHIRIRYKNINERYEVNLFIKIDEDQVK